MNEMEVAEMIEKYIEYVDTDGRKGRRRPAAREGAVAVAANERRGRRKASAKVVDFIDTD
jgi:hypothetical protein